MRDIKFRGKAENSDKWYIGDFISDTNEFNRTCDEAFILPHWNKLNSPIQVIKETVGQYTGLKDKNGVEVYEGDIVKQEYEVTFSVEYHPESLGYMGSDDDEGHHIGEVVIIASKGVCLKNPIRYSVGEDNTEQTKLYKSVAAYRSEVIGNIYENPELLAGEENAETSQ